MGESEPCADAGVRLIFVRASENIGEFYHALECEKRQCADWQH